MRVDRHKDKLMKESKMKFVLLVYQGTTPLPGSESWNAMSHEEQKAVYTEYAELHKTPGFTPGLPLGLPNAARTVQVKDGKINVREGTHLQEGAGGYFVFEADDIDAAVVLAARVPAARLGGAIEIRPAEQYW